MKAFTVILTLALTMIATTSNAECWKRIQAQKMLRSDATTNSLTQMAGTNMNPQLSQTPGAPGRKQ